MVPRLLCLCPRAQELHPLKPMCPRACATQEESPQWEACTPQVESSPMISHAAWSKKDQLSLAQFFHIKERGPKDLAWFLLIVLKMAGTWHKSCQERERKKVKWKHSQAKKFSYLTFRRQRMEKNKNKGQEPLQDC